MADKEYTTKTKVETFIGETISGSIDDIILAAQDYIDGYTGRNFKADAAATARKYDGNDSQEIDIDDCVEITKVEAGNDQYGDNLTTISAGGSNGYYLYPANYSQEGIPIRKVHLRARTFLAGFANNQITAKWGYSATPPDAIVQAATILVAILYKYGQEGVSGGVASEKIGEYSVSFDKGDESENNALKEYMRVKVILDKYKRFRLGA